MNKLAKQQNSVGIISNSQQIKNVSKSQVGIYNASLVSKKFKEYATEKDLLLMNALITKWAKYVGAKQPEAIDLNTIANYIRESFPNFNDVDLNELITLLVNGRLDTDAEHYGGMSIIYCSKVLHAYQRYKYEVLFKVREELQKIENAKPKPINKAERLQNFKNLLVHAKKYSDKETFIDTGDVVYDFVKKNKLLKISKQTIDDALDYGKKRLTKENHKKAIESVVKIKPFQTQEEIKFDKDFLVTKYAREYVLNIWLKDVDISKIVDNLTYEMIDF